MIRHVSSIGRFCSIASNVVSGQVEHPTDFISAAPLFTGSTLPGAKPAERSEFEEANRSMMSKAARTLGASLAGRRTEGRRVGTDCVHTGRSGWSPLH